MAASGGMNKGQTMVWQAPQLHVRIERPEPCDVSALILQSDEKVRDSKDFVFYNAPSAPGVSWTKTDYGQLLRIVPSQLEGHVTTVRCLVSVDGHQLPFGRVLPPRVVIDDGSGRPEEEVTFTPVGLTTERAVALVDLYRRGGVWKVRAVGQGWDGGLEKAISLHGVEIDDAPAPAPAPMAPDPAASMLEEDVVFGALRVSRAILEDLGRSAAGYESSVGYADWRLAADVEQISEDPRLRGAAGDQLRRDAQARRDDLVARAAAQHETDLRQLATEVSEFEASLPLMLAAFSAAAWRPENRQHAPARAIDAVRLGRLHLPDKPHVAVPMLAPFPSRALLWVDSTSAPPQGTALAVQLIARAIASSPAGTVQVHVVDLTGDLIEALSPAALQGCALVSTARNPHQAAGMVRSLAERVDLTQMALEAGLADAAVEMSALTLLVVNDLPLGFDAQTMGRLSQLCENGRHASMQVLVLTRDTEVDQDINPLVAAVAEPCLWLSSDTRTRLSDAVTQTQWQFDPEVSRDASAFSTGLLAQALSQAPYRT